jgi:hypothetical protein
MTGAPAALANLLADCDAHGIRLMPAGDGGLTIDSPQDALTPGLLDRLKAHKADVLAFLRSIPDSPGIDPTDAAALWQAALDRLEGDPLFPPGLMENLRAADVRWADSSPTGEPTPESGEPVSPDGWPADCIDPDELTPCPKCGTLELWQTAAGDLFGRTPGRWRCMKCDPPTAARRLAEAAERIRRQTNRGNTTRRKG